MTAEDVAGLARMFGVDFTQEDTDTLQKWMNEEASEQTNE